MLEIGGRLDRAVRPRRLRATPSIRALVRETRLHPRRLIAPLFVVPGEGRRERIPSLAGCERLSPDLTVGAARALCELQVGGVLLFGVPGQKDDFGLGASDSE